MRPGHCGDRIDDDWNTRHDDGWLPLMRSAIRTQSLASYAMWAENGEERLVSAGRTRAKDLDGIGRLTIGSKTAVPNPSHNSDLATAQRILRG